MATTGALISRENFSTTPYNYQVTSVTDKSLYCFYKSNVCWDVYIYSYARCYISFEFYDYGLSSWIPYTSDSYSYNDMGFQYRTEQQSLRFFHNSNAHWTNQSYTADIKIRDNQSLSYGGYTYDTRGYSLWRIRFVAINSGIGFDFHMNSYGPGQLTVREYSDVCLGKKIYCGGKGDPNSDDQYIKQGNPSSLDYLDFNPFYFMGKTITADFDRKCIPDWTSFRT